MCIHLADALGPGGLLPQLGVQQVAGPHLCVQIHYNITTLQHYRYITTLQHYLYLSPLTTSPLTGTLVTTLWRHSTPSSSHICTQRGYDHDTYLGTTPLLRLSSGLTLGGKMSCMMECSLHSSLSPSPGPCCTSLPHISIYLSTFIYLSIYYMLHLICIYSYLSHVFTIFTSLAGCSPRG